MYILLVFSCQNWIKWDYKILLLNSTIWNFILELISQNQPSRKQLILVKDILVDNVRTFFFCYESAFLLILTWFFLFCPVAKNCCLKSRFNKVLYWALLRSVNLEMFFWWHRLWCHQIDKKNEIFVRTSALAS